MAKAKEEQEKLIAKVRVEQVFMQDQLMAEIDDASKQWGIAQDQRGLVQESTTTWSTLHKVAKFERAPESSSQAILTCDHGWAYATTLHHAQDRFH